MTTREVCIRAANMADREALCHLYREFHEFHVCGVPDRLLSLGEPPWGRQGRCLQRVVDGGTSPGAMTAHLGQRMPFYDRHLDLVVLTHPHDDHLVGLIECVERHQVRQVVDPGIPATTSTYARWLELLEERGIPTYPGRRGALQPVELGHGVVLTLLHPPPALLENTESDANNNSVVLRLAWGAVSFLLTRSAKRVNPPGAALSTGCFAIHRMLRNPQDASQSTGCFAIHRMLRKARRRARIVRR